MQKIILSPPISNLITVSGTSRIVGSYTLDQRSGLWRNLTTLRPTKDGWYNRVGLKNPGINKYNKAGIVSLAGFSASDYKKMLDTLAYNPKVEAVEFNISCPNAKVSIINSDIIKLATNLFGRPIVKIPHGMHIDDICSLLEMGDIILHISNTKKTEKGALSGVKLIDVNLATIREVKKISPDTTIIGGGGIYSIATLEKYMHAGADHFSLSTVLLNPYRAYKIINYFKP